MIAALNHALEPSLSRLRLGNQILHETDLKLIEEGPKIIILKSDISALETTYQWPEFFEIPQYNITKR